MTDPTFLNFSAHNPNMRLAWDATSLADFTFCPRFYQETHLRGYFMSKVDFEFGGMAASTFERFQKARLAGASHADAMLQALRYAFEASWVFDDEDPDDDERPYDEGHPWGGVYQDQWHCMGDKPYKNSKGNRAKCPYSHKGAWFPNPAPHVCGECGGTIEHARHYLPDDENKNRETLLRLVTWYMLEQPENPEDGLHAYRFPDGTAAVELSFAVPLPWTNAYGEAYSLAGHMDNIGVFGEETWIVDQKSTKKSLNDAYFNTYAPHWQFDTYDMVGNALFPELRIKGVLVDAAQTLVEGAKFGRHPYRKTDGMREEHLASIEFWLKQAEYIAEKYGEKDWPMNKNNCWKCALRKFCALDPAQRRDYMDAALPRRTERWNPLKTR